MEERRRTFTTQISLGNIIAGISFVLAAVGLYINVIQDVNAQKIEVNHLKQNEQKKEAESKEFRQEIKQEIREIKTEVKSLDDKMDKFLDEIRKLQPRSERSR